MRSNVWEVFSCMFPPSMQEPQGKQLGSAASGLKQPEEGPECDRLRSS